MGSIQDRASSYSSRSRPSTADREPGERKNALSTGRRLLGTPRRPLRRVSRPRECRGGSFVMSSDTTVHDVPRHRTDHRAALCGTQLGPCPTSATSARNSRRRRSPYCPEPDGFGGFQNTTRGKGRRGLNRAGGASNACRIEPGAMDVALEKYPHPEGVPGSSPSCSMRCPRHLVVAVAGPASNCRPRQGRRPRSMAAAEHGRGVGEAHRRTRTCPQGFSALANKCLT